MSLQELPERYAHLLLDGAWGVHVTGNVEQLSARVTLAAERGEPLTAATADRLKGCCDCVIYEI